MMKKTNVEKQFAKVQTSSVSAVSQFQETIGTLEYNNQVLTTIFEDAGAEIERLTSVQRSTMKQIDENTTVIQGIKNVLGR